MSLGDTWHKLTLEELICLTSSKSLVELTKEYEKKPNQVQLLITDQGAMAELDNDLTPPRAGAQDNLNSYIILRWCPWFSQAFGVILDANLNMLTLDLLRFYTEDAPILLELLTATSLVLKQPNIPYSPTCRDESQVARFLSTSTSAATT